MPRPVLFLQRLQDLLALPGLHFARLVFNLARLGLPFARHEFHFARLVFHRPRVLFHQPGDPVPTANHKTALSLHLPFAWTHWPLLVYYLLMS